MKDNEINLHINKSYPEITDLSLIIRPITVEEAAEEDPILETSIEVVTTEKRIESKIAYFEENELNATTTIVLASPNRNPRIVSDLTDPFHTTIAKGVYSKYNLNTGNPQVIILSTEYCLPKDVAKRLDQYPSLGIAGMTNWPVTEIAKQVINEGPAFSDNMLKSNNYEIKEF